MSQVLSPLRSMMLQGEIVILPYDFMVSLGTNFIASISMKPNSSNSLFSPLFLPSSVFQVAVRPTTLASFVA